MFVRISSRNRSLIFLVLAFCGAAMASPKSCLAQELRRYQPSTPTVSPYLSLNRANAGGLPNYYALVRPLSRQRQVNLQTQRLQLHQSASLQQLGQSQIQLSQQPSQAVTGTASRYMTTGRHFGYRNTLQFYPAVSSSR